jgi:hypothetical protein
MGSSFAPHGSGRALRSRIGAPMRAAAPEIPHLIAPAAAPAPLSPRRVEREFRARLARGAVLRCDGSATASRLLASYAPRHRVDLFDTTYYLGAARQNEDLRFFVGYVAQRVAGAERLHARLFYKDVSLIWRCASHFARSARENWIGKGDVRTIREGAFDLEVSHESTTDLPLEVQDAFEQLNRSAGRIRTDHGAVERVLRRAPDSRIQAFADFTGPRRRARANPRNLVHGGRPVARFARAGDPASLRFARGYEPDFRRGALEHSAAPSSLYGGLVRRFRILSANRRIQYLFMAGPRHVWIIPPQATTTELSSFGVRTVDVAVDDDLCVPGWEYHGGAEEGLSGLDQIPRGYAGERHPRDPSRADASRWLEALPVIREFRRTVLRARK